MKFGLAMVVVNCTMKGLAFVFVLAVYVFEHLECFLGRLPGRWRRLGSQGIIREHNVMERIRQQGNWTTADAIHVVD